MKYLKKAGMWMGLRKGLSKNMKKGVLLVLVFFIILNYNVLASGPVKCWGYNIYGQLGDETTTNRLTPVSVLDIANTIEITAGVHGKR